MTNRIEGGDLFMRDPHSFLLWHKIRLRCYSASKTFDSQSLEDFEGKKLGTCSIKGGIQKLKMAERAVCANLGNMHDFIFYFTT